MNTSIQPWLTFEDCFKALEFYKAAFGAQECYHFEPAEGDLISRLSIKESEFWIARGGKAVADAHQNVRFVVIVENPEQYCKKAIAAGATEIFSVREEHGWRTGKIADPFGYQWEFGYEVNVSAS